MSKSPAASVVRVPVAFEVVGVVEVILVPLRFAASRSVWVTTQVRWRWRSLRSLTDSPRGHTYLASVGAHGDGGVLLHDLHQAFMLLALLGLLLGHALLAAHRLPLLQVLDLTSGRSDRQ